MIKVLRQVFFFISPILKFTVQEESMIPLLYPGDTILVYRFAYLFIDPKPLDIVVIRLPKEDKYLIKEIDKVKKDKYFVLGKNREKSLDSRKFGWISRDNIIGKVII